jgi:hypothetical protein
MAKLNNDCHIFMTSSLSKTRSFRGFKPSPSTLLFSPIARPGSKEHRDNCQIPHKYGPNRTSAGHSPARLSRAVFPTGLSYVVQFCPGKQTLCEHSSGTTVQVFVPDRASSGRPLKSLESIHEFSPVSTGEVYDRMKWARLWKSIILSSIAGTAYPYCTYVRALSLGNFQSLLEEIGNDRGTRSELFNAQDNTEQFLVLREGQPKRPTRNRGMVGIDYQGTLVKAGESITKYIKEVADQIEKAVALAHLEANRIPTEHLPTWISRLETLTSLRIQEGDVLTAEAGSAISQSCPRFAELTCHFCRGPSVDKNMAAFLQTLRPNSLRRFEVMSMNDLAEQTLTALNVHAEALTHLTLGSMSSQAMKSLNVLPSCRALESLTIENTKANPISLKDYSENILKEITAWIRSCNHLEDLTFTNVQDACKSGLNLSSSESIVVADLTLKVRIVKDILDTPSIRLKSLSLQGFRTQGREYNSATWAALGLQDSLENLTIGGQIDDLDGLIVDQSTPLVASICKLKRLEGLNLIQAFVRTAEIRQFVTHLPNLTELQFGGSEHMDDVILGSLSSLRHLKVLVINAFSVFTLEGLQLFALRLDPIQHQGIRVDIINQIGEHKLDDASTTWLADHFANVLDGRFDIGYFQDPDELHESDFSTLSD